MFNGYTQVAAFSEDVLEEEEVVYVTLDLGSDLYPNLSSLSSFQLIGLDTDKHAFLRLSGTASAFKGRPNPVLGSQLIFSQDNGLSFVANAEHNIAFKEVILQAKEDVIMEEENDAQVDKSSARADGGRPLKKQKTRQSRK
ncbi:hypothetical protein C8J56DRAFT_971788 [Mycena floridula]|nr:hypothetical protein C8J56DRAFT_971788 [Mycena floridula]